MQHSCEQSHWSFMFFFVWFPLSQHSLAITYVYFFTTFTYTNYTRVSVSVSGDCTRVSHKTNTSACRNSTVSPKLSRFTSSSRWTWTRGPLILHSWSEATLTHKMAFLGISMRLFQKQNITRMPGMLFLMFVQSLFQFGAKEGIWEGYYGDKNYLDMFFTMWKSKSSRLSYSLVESLPPLSMMNVRSR